MKTLRDLAREATNFKYRIVTLGSTYVVRPAAPPDTLRFRASRSGDGDEPTSGTDKSRAPQSKRTRRALCKTQTHPNKQGLNIGLMLHQSTTDHVDATELGLGVGAASEDLSCHRTIRQPARMCNVGHSIPSVHNDCLPLHT